MSLIGGRKKRDVGEHDMFLDGHTDPMTCKQLTGHPPDSQGRCPMLVRQYGSKKVIANDEITIVRTDHNSDDTDDY